MSDRETNGCVIKERCNCLCAVSVEAGRTDRGMQKRDRNQKDGGRERKQTPCSGGFSVTSRLQINPANWFVPRQGHQMTGKRRECAGEEEAE